MTGVTDRHNALPAIDGRSAPQSRTTALRLVSDRLMIRDVYLRIANEYIREERRLAAEKAAAELRIARESRLDAILETIERAKSGQTIMVRGQQNIDALASLNFCSLSGGQPRFLGRCRGRPRDAVSPRAERDRGLLTARERFRPIEEMNRLEFYFLVHRSDDDPAAFERMARKYRERNGTERPIR